MFNLGMGEITVILLLALIFLGPKRLPDLASGLGRLIRDIRKATSDVKNEIALDETFRKPFEELRDAVTLHPDELKRRDQIRQSLEDARKRAEELERVQQAAQAAAAAEVTEGESVSRPADGEAAPSMTPIAVTAAAGAALEAVDPAATQAPAPVTPLATHMPPPAPSASHAPPPGPLASQAPPAPSPASHAPPPAPLASQAPPGPSSASHAPPPALAGQVAPPTAPPPGTVAAPPTRLGPPRVSPPVSSLFGENANKTQALSEEDLLPPSPPALPSGPPVRKSTPPPLPGLVKPPPLPPGPKKA